MVVGVIEDVVVALNEIDTETVAVTDAEAPPETELVPVCEEDGVTVILDDSLLLDVAE